MNLLNKYTMVLFAGIFFVGTYYLYYQVNKIILGKKLVEANKLALNHQFKMANERYNKYLNREFKYPILYVYYLHYLFILGDAKKALQLNPKFFKKYQLLRLENVILLNYMFKGKEAGDSSYKQLLNNKNKRLYPSNDVEVRMLIEAIYLYYQDKLNASKDILLELRNMELFRSEALNIYHSYYLMKIYEKEGKSELKELEYEKAKELSRGTMYYEFLEGGIS